MADFELPSRSLARIARDNNDEVQAWLDERTAALVARGVPPGSARQQAQAEFGDVAVATRYAQAEDNLLDRRRRVAFAAEELWSDLRLATRAMKRTPVTAAVVLATFALGVGATTAMFSVIHALLLRPLPYADEPRLVYLPSSNTSNAGPPGRQSAGVYFALREHAHTLRAVAALEVGSAVVTEGGRDELVRTVGLSPDGFDVLGTRAALGRTLGAGDAQTGADPVVVLSHSAWMRRFGGDSSIIGRTVEMLNRRFVVVGVMPAGFRAPTYEEAEYFFLRDPAAHRDSPNALHARAFRLFARLTPEISPEVAQADVGRVMQQLGKEFPAEYAGLETNVVPIRTAITGSVRTELVLLMGAAGFLLLLACANVAGVLLSRAIARRHELALRVSLGAGRFRLVRQFLAEGLAFGLLGVVCAAGTAQLAILLLRQIAVRSLPAGTHFELEPRVLVLALVLALGASLVTSLVPALWAAGMRGFATQREDFRASMSTAGRHLRLGLLTGQLALAIVLLLGTGLFLQSLGRIMRTDLGYHTEQRLSFRVTFSGFNDARQDAFWDGLYARLRQTSGVVAAGGGNVPLGQHSLTTLIVDGRNDDHTRRPEVRHSVASDGYFATLGIPLVEGRAFSPEDRAGAPDVVVVSQSLARQLWAGGPALGRRLKFDGDTSRAWSTVVGIVGDVRMGAADVSQPSLYTSQRQDHWPGGGTVVVRTTGDPGQFFSEMRRAGKDIDPAVQIVEMQTLDDTRAGTPGVTGRKLPFQLLFGFSLIALVVSAVGVFGASAYSATARSREFGIRVALGSSRFRILRLSLEDSIFAVMFASIVGLPLAWILGARARSLLYEVRASDPLVSFGSIAVLTVVVLAASLIPALKVSRADPMATMRSE